MNNLFSWFTRIFRHSSSSSGVSAAENPDIVREAAWSIFQFHWTALDILDQKASSLLAMVGVMITLLVSLRPAAVCWRTWQCWLFAAGLICMLISSLLAFSAWRVKMLSVPPTPQDILDYFNHPNLDQPTRQTSEMIIRQLNGAIDDNRPVAKAKIQRLNWAYNLLIVGLVLIVTYALVR